ncbi:hypothetical protein AWB76_02430 [Caballeronia temeraria]|uniref:Uncharacterized protein n=1 Tax=Caballeronia temeraria TaxID=1777137 RepID=A0A158AHN9_9BURK|nr:hypothetical protein [Caballeronia temeraria]SAK57303.1 hypothetical protein AWB76_02430 [Caballeronia temeraria]
MDHINDAWLINERTNGDWVLFGYRAGHREKVGTLTDAALVELFLKAGDGADEATLRALLLRALRNHLCGRPVEEIPVLDTPLDFD